RLAEMREKAGDREGAEDFARQAADHGNPEALIRLAEMREKAGERESAETLYRQAADRGMGRDLLENPSRTIRARQAADRGMSRDLLENSFRTILTGRWPNGLDPDGTPTPPWQ
ncbi:hypothetical protein ACLQ2A_34185, partial [Streptomyces prasinus]